MPSQDDEPNKNIDEEIAEVPDEAEETPQDEQLTDTDDTPSDTQADEPKDALGDNEQVMPDDEPPKRPGKIKRCFAGYWRKKKWTLPLTILVIIAAVFAVPATRYPLLALQMKRQFAIVVRDSKTNTPVSGAIVTLDGKTVMTNSEGGATFNAKVGERTVAVSKKYYKDFSESIFVGALHKSTNARFVNLVATGRQVPIKVVNKITGKPLVNAEVKVLDTEAKTDTDGKATIVLPTGSSTQPATINASGYNNLNTKVQITSQTVSANTFQITPSGRVYFLSNLSGNIDVVSTDLDGTGRQTVLAGTGSEDSNNTVLLASRDWKYLALLSKRDGGQYAKLYLINTGNDQLTTIDEGSATFTPVGWSGHYFVYEANRANVQDWQAGQYALKSFNADSGKITTLDQTTASGSSINNYIGQDLGYSAKPTIIGSAIVYAKEWNYTFSVTSSALSGKQDQILSINADGSNRQVLKGVPLPGSNDFQSINSVPYSPTQIYFQVINTSGSTYYVYENGNVTQSNTLTADSYNQYAQNYSTYLLSPSGNQTFWAELRDGKNTLFVGDADGKNGKQIASLSDYTSYGWYTDNYLLVEKGGSELYIMPTTGGTAQKISDYYKPQQNFNGYGSGYGGL